MSLYDDVMAKYQSYQQKAASGEIKVVSSPTYPASVPIAPTAPKLSSLPQSLLIYQSGDTSGLIRSAQLYAQQATTSTPITSTLATFKSMNPTITSLAPKNVMSDYPFYQSYPNPTIVSKPVIQQSLQQNISYGEQQIADIENMYGTPVFFKSNASYINTIGDRELVLSGSMTKVRYLMNKFRNQKIVKPKLESYISQNKKSLWAISNLPEEITFKKTNEGYETVIPESISLGTTKYFLGEYKSNPLMQFNTGFVSSIFSFIKPVVSWFGIKNQDIDMAASFAFSANALDVKSSMKRWGSSTKYLGYSQHYVSPLDVAFEPIGLSPKGSTEIMAKYPVFTAGGIASEFAQAYIGGQILKPINIGVKTGVKSVVSKTPTIYSKFSTKFPKVFSKVITESGDIVGSNTSKFISRVGETQFSRNLYNWAARGYKPGTTLVYRTLGRQTDDVLGLRITRGVYERIPGSRSFLSPESFAKYQSKIASSNILNIGFPSNLEENISFAAEGESLSKRLFGSGLKSELFNITKSKYIGYDVPLIDETYTRFGFGNYYRDLLDDIVTPVKEFGYKKPISSSFLRSSGPEWFEETTKMYSSNYPSVFTNLEGGGQIIDFVEGFGGSGISHPEPKAWITKMQNSFFRSEEAATSLVGGTRQVFKFPSISVSSGGRFSSRLIMPLSIDSSLLSRTGYSIIRSGIPMLGYKPEFNQIIVKSPIYSSNLNIRSIGGVSQRYKPIIDYSSELDKISIKSPLFDYNKDIISKYKYLTLFSPINETKQDVRPLFKLVTPLVSKQDVMLKMDIPLMSKYSYDFKPVVSIPVSSFSFKPLPPFIPFGFGGGGGGWSDINRSWGKGYRFRRWKVPKLSNFVGRW